MSDCNPCTDLDLEEDFALQRREWRWQRVGWVVLFENLGAALPVVFCDGPLSSSKATSHPRREVSSPAFAADYTRFTRAGQSSRITIRLEGIPPESRVLPLKAERRFHGHAHFERIAPEPDCVALGEKSIALAYGAGRLHQRGGTSIIPNANGGMQLWPRNEGAISICSPMRG